MAKHAAIQRPESEGTWTPCWSAHAYGFDNARWREGSLDGQDCRCSPEKIAEIQEEGRVIMARWKKTYG